MEETSCIWDGCASTAFCMYKLLYFYIVDASQLQF